MLRNAGITGVIVATALLLAAWLTSTDDQTQLKDSVEPAAPIAATDAEPPQIDAVADSLSDEIDGRSPTLAYDPSTKKDGDVVGSWGELVTFQVVLTNCRVDEAGSGKTLCEPEIVPDHPYAHFSDDQLRQIADYDGEAALVLGVRLGYRKSPSEENDESADLLRGALVLTGHVDALNFLMTFEGVPDAPRYSDGALNVDHASRRYIWNRIGYDLGLVSDDSLNAAARPLLALADFDVDGLNQEAAKRTDWFRQRRFALTGESF